MSRGSSGSLPNLAMKVFRSAAPVDTVNTCDPVEVPVMKNGSLARTDEKAAMPSRPRAKMAPKLSWGSFIG